jgi:iron complex outermembrane receptor protein
MIWVTGVFSTGKMGNHLADLCNPAENAEHLGRLIIIQVHHFVRFVFQKPLGLWRHAMDSQRVVRRCAFLALLACLALPAGSAQTPDLTQKSLEDLMNIDVTSVSKKAQKTSETAAAVFVISAEEIRRSGAQNIPDLLRMVPGLDVAQINGSQWAISARGFNGQYSNKLLVLIDGRTVYNTVFAGVFWDSQIVPLESIERIEVIRGPGAAVWGSNAVNGVINIITKSANETQGGSVDAGAGDTIIGPETIRYGGKVRGLGAYRVFAEGFHAGSLPTPEGLDGQDDWRLVHGGFRTDSNLSEKDSLTTEGDVTQGNAGELATVPVSIEPPVNATMAMRNRYWDWNLLARWKRTISPRSETSLQVYFDRTTREDPTYGIGLNTLDIDFQHHVACGARQDIVWGLGYRLSADGTNPTMRIVFTPQNLLTHLFSIYAQDEIAILPNRLRLSVGARLEHNGYTGFDLEPSARLAWSLNSKNMFWSAVSSAVRTPARSDRDIRVNYAAFPEASLPLLINYFGNPNAKNERLMAFEAGYRDSWTSNFSVDSTIFYNRYGDLQSVEPGAIVLETTPAPAHMLIPILYDNKMYGETHGIEFFANWKAASHWTLSPGYAFFSMHLHKFAGSLDTTSAQSTVGSTPDHQAQLRSSVSLPKNLQWNASAYFVNRLPSLAIPSYTRVDTGLTWQAGEHISISAVGQNLFSDHHMEYSGFDSSEQSGLMRRSAYAKISWSF